MSKMSGNSLKVFTLSSGPDTCYRSLKQCNTAILTRITLHLVSKLRQVQPFVLFRRPTPPQVLPERPADFNPLQWLLDPDKSRTLANRVLAALIQLEAHEENPVFRDDYRQIFVAISSGLAGDSQPFVTASYRMFGVHPDNLWPAIVAKRKAKLGKEYSALYDENDNLRPSSEWGAVPCPKKPSQSVKTLLKEKTDVA